MPVFKVRVPTTNERENFYIDSDGDHMPCEGGVVFIIAESPAVVAEHVPDMISLKRVGVGVFLHDAEEEEDGEPVEGTSTDLTRYIL